MINLSLVENCTDTYYLNVQSVGLNGLSSSIISSDGVIALNPGGDPDADGHINENELVAESNACNPDSTPQDTMVYLKKGFNLISVPADVTFKPDLRDWLPVFGNSSEIEKVMVFDKKENSFVTMIPEALSNQSFTLQGSEALIVYAKMEKDILFSSVLCKQIALDSGFNLTGINCPPEGYHAYQLLQDSDRDNIISIQWFNPRTADFETAAFDNTDQPVGVDFAIKPGEGYFIFALPQ
ncbi:MAG: hypothetical protein KJ804_16240 [Proteobacteria bacterium]|nr:hypothetical protein [Pseudomonadota bacterium]